MKKNIFYLFLFLAPVLFLIGAALPFVSNGDTVAETSRLIYQEEEFFFTVFGRVSMVVTIGYLGVVLYVMGDPIKKMLGKSLYALSSLFAFILLLIHFRNYSNALDGSDDPGLGLFILFAAVALGLVMTIVIVLLDIIRCWLEENYGVDVQVTTTSNKDINVFKELKKWKELLDQELLTEDDYNTIKEKRLEKISFKKMNSVDVVTSLKKAYEDSLISKNDFDSLKSTIIESLN